MVLPRFDTRFDTFDTDNEVIFPDMRVACSCQLRLFLRPNALILAAGRWITLGECFDVMQFARGRNGRHEGEREADIPSMLALSLHIRDRVLEDNML